MGPLRCSETGRRLRELGRQLACDWPERRRNLRDRVARWILGMKVEVALVVFFGVATITTRSWNR
jgi:hypothetical protein